MRIKEILWHINLEKGETYTQAVKLCKLPSLIDLDEEYLKECSLKQYLEDVYLYEPVSYTLEY